MKYTKNNVMKKRNQLSSEQIRKHSKISLFLFKYLLIAAIALIAAFLGLSVGYVRGILKTTPQITKESVHSKGHTTTIYDKEGKKLSTLSSSDSSKIYTPLSEIPKNLQNAFIAIEDERFYSHNGIDFYGAIRTAFLNIKSKSKIQGGGTITQQLVKNNVLGIQSEKTWMERIERKIKEQSLSLELENIASKEFILEEYLNTINLGEGTLGVQAASQKYFNKNSSDLTLSECAVLASIADNPSRYHPIDHPENNASKRQIVLQKMLKQHYITKTEYREAMQDDVYARIRKNASKPSNETNSNSSFQDAMILQVVEDLKDQLGYDETKAYNAVYNGGLKIYSTQDSTIQMIADEAANDASYYPSDAKVALTYTLTVRDTNGDDVTYSENNVLEYMKKHNLGDSLIFSSTKEAENAAGHFRQSVEDSGSVIVGEYISTPIQPQVSITIIDQTTGAVEALVGGRGNVRTTSLTEDRAVFAQKQPGSNFKILSTFLPALDRGKVTLASVYDDAPYHYLDSNYPIKNYYDGYKGYTTIREAITDSVNVVAAKTMTDVTPQRAYQYLLDLGFDTLVDDEMLEDGTTNTDIHQSLSLGGLTNGVTNLELTNAYASIANGGTYHKAKLYTKVVDQNGNILLSNDSSGERVMKESTSFLLTNAMEDVLEKGTGTAAKLSSDMPAAGKSGTTSDHTNYWFTGYTPYHTTSIWMGYDLDYRFESNDLHKEMWADIMDKIIEEKGENTKAFEKPDNIVEAKICKKSGKLAIPGICDHDPRGSMITTEYFAKGTVPTQTCDTHVSVELCKDSQEPVTSNCPKEDRIKKIYIVRTKNSQGETADTPYLLPEKYKNSTCHIHKEEKD